MAPQQRKRSAAAQRNLERMGYSPQNDSEDGPRRGAESVTMRRLKLVLTFLRQSILSLRTPERFWLLLFLPSFVRYLLLMRTSLRPRPLVVGEVVDFGSLEPLVSPQAQLEVVAEDLHGALVAPLWAHDAALGRGYLLFSQLDRNRLWRWEEGYGAFTIGKSLFLEHAGCSSRLAVGATEDAAGVDRASAANATAASMSPCAEPGSGVLGMALGSPEAEGSADAGERPLLLVESGNARVAKVEASSGKFVPLVHASDAAASSKGSSGGGHAGALTGAAVVGTDGTLYYGVGADPQEFAAWTQAKANAAAHENASTEAEGQASGAGEAVVSEGKAAVPEATTPSMPSGWIMALPPLPSSSEATSSGGATAGAVPRPVRMAAAAHPVGLALNAAGDVLLIADADPAQPGGAVWRQHLLPSSSAAAAAGTARSKKSTSHARSAHTPRTATATDATVFASLPEGLTCDRPGGVAVDMHGNVWAACGFGGVVVFNPAGEVRGVINTGGKYTVTGVAFGDDGFLYITAAEGSVLRVAAKAKATLVAN